MGWTMFPIYRALNKPGTMGKSALHKTTANAFRLALYEGTPRALFSLHPIAGAYVCREINYSNFSVVELTMLASQLLKH